MTSAPAQNEIQKHTTNAPMVARGNCCTTVLGARVGGGAAPAQTLAAETAAALCALVQKLAARAPDVLSMQKPLAEAEIRAWLALCSALRNANSIPTVADFQRILAVCLPTAIRPECVYSPLKTAAWKAAFGAGKAAVGADADTWYDRAHGDDMALPAARFAIWCGSADCRAAVSANCRWLLASQHSLREQGRPAPLASVVQWHRLLQAAYDFGLPVLFEELMAAAHADRAWSSDELAMFTLIW
jgi:hypothetical protein